MITNLGGEEELVHFYKTHGLTYCNRKLQGGRENWPGSCWRRDIPLHTVLLWMILTQGHDVTSTGRGTFLQQQLFGNERPTSLGWCIFADWWEQRLSPKGGDDWPISREGRSRMWPSGRRWKGKRPDALVCDKIFYCRPNLMLRGYRGLYPLFPYLKDKQMLWEQDHYVN